MNRDAKTQTALIALARTRRMQRALAHAYVHHDAPLPTLRLSTAATILPSIPATLDRIVLSIEC